MDQRKRCPHCNTVLLFNRPWCKEKGTHHGDNGRLCFEIWQLREQLENMSRSLCEARLEAKELRERFG